MTVTVSNKITVISPSDEIKKYCKENLVIPNPEYTKKSRMGFYTGNTPRTLTLYEVEGDTVKIPFGCLRQLIPMFGDALVFTEFKPKREYDYLAEVPLYDYQEVAVEEMIKQQYGILQAPAGSGKTQMGIAIASKLQRRTLWVTHTLDLLNQSRTRAERYFDKSIIGTITEGKVNIGSHITFATIQTLCKLDLSDYKYTWDCVIVDECHRVAGTPTAMSQFSKVLNSLAARHKFGLSATVHRSDGMITSTYALLGEVAYNVPKESVKDTVLQVEVDPVQTGTPMNPEMLNTDGTINYSSMISELIRDDARNHIILSDLIENDDHFNLILSERLEHLETLMSLLPTDILTQSVMIHGKMTSKKGKADRKKAIQDMRDGKKRYLFATYSLAKEGLDIPRLDRLYLTTPQKDYAVIVQSIGRIARTFPGKTQPIAYDYVDNMRNLIKTFKTRCTSYRKCGCVIKKE